MKVNLKTYIYFQGKSLSLICGALKWLEDHEKKQRESFENMLSGNLTDEYDCDYD